MITLESISVGLPPKHKFLEKEHKKYREYQKSLVDFVFWWNDHVVTQNGDKLEGSFLLYKGITCYCTEVNVIHRLFTCSVEFIPVNIADDIGSGAGNKITITH